MNLSSTAKIINLWSITLLLMLSCSNPNKSSSDNTKDATPQGDSSATRLGGFLLARPYNNEIVDLQDLSVSIEDFDVAGFPKQMETYGTRFAIMRNVPDDFVNEVALTFHQMFPQDSNLNREMQEKVLSSMLQYRSLIPVLEGRYETIQEDVKEGMEKLSNDYSVADIIMYKDGTGRQTMEVVEHLLHYISSIGLHLTFPKEWSFTDTQSEVVAVMNQAVELGLYDIDGYNDILEDDKNAYQRVLVQEFSYWLISTYWNLQEPYGPIDEEEWKIDNKQQLLEKLPAGYQLVENTVNKFMRSPSREVLEKFRKYN